MNRIGIGININSYKTKFKPCKLWSQQMRVVHMEINARTCMINWVYVFRVFFSFFSAHVSVNSVVEIWFGSSLLWNICLNLGISRLFKWPDFQHICIQQTVKIDTWLTFMIIRKQYICRVQRHHNRLLRNYSTSNICCWRNVLHPPLIK